MKYTKIAFILVAFIVGGQSMSETESSLSLKSSNEGPEAIVDKTPTSLIAGSSTCELSKCLSNCDKNYSSGSVAHKNCQLRCTAKCD